MRSWTGYPRINHQMPHLAPVMGAMPIFSRRPGVPPVPTHFGAVDPAAREGSPPVDASPSGPDPETAQSDAGLLAEAGLGIATAAISGGVTGGVAAGTWRGAVIGAGLNAGLWSGFTAASGWGEFNDRLRMVLTGAAVVGLGAAATLALTRRS